VTWPGHDAAPIQADRILRFVSHRSLALSIEISAACLNVVCPEGKTCQRGACVDAHVDDSKDAGTDAGESCACVADLPAGWGWVGYEPDARDACPAGYDMPADVVEGIDWKPAPCSCSCSVQSQPSCAPPQQLLLKMGDAQCGGSGGSTFNLQFTPSCTAKSGSASALQQVYAVAQTTVPKPAGGMCLGAASITPPAPYAFMHEGRKCDFAAAPGIGCPNVGDVCLPPATAPWSICVESSGVQACPAGYPIQHMVGGSATDTRGCSPCSCAMQAACDDPILDLHSDNMCQSAVVSITTNQLCASTGISSSVQFASFSVTAPLKSVACTAPANYGPIGDVSFDAPVTVCCVK